MIRRPAGCWLTRGRGQRPWGRARNGEAEVEAVAPFTSATWAERLSREVSSTRYFLLKYAEQVRLPIKIEATRLTSSS